MRVLVAALCVAAFGCRERGTAPLLETVEPSLVYNDEAPLFVLRGSFEPPVMADLDDPAQSRLAPYAVQLVSSDEVFDLPAGAFQGPGRIETSVAAGTPPGVYTVRLTDPWGRETSLVGALTVRFRFSATAPDAPINIDPPGGGPVRAPPTASFAFYVTGFDWAVAGLTDPLQVDGTPSTDTQTPAADLQMSWNFTGNPVPPPWGSYPWTTVKTASYQFTRSGPANVVLAAMDADGDIGYAARALSVVGTGSEFCFVTTALPGDDGATDCSEKGSGPDRRLSFDEAVRLANANSGIQIIMLYADPALAPVTFAGDSPLILTRTVHIIGTPGAIIGREIIAQNGPMTLISVELAAPGKLTIPHGYSMVLLDSLIRESSVWVAGELEIERSRFVNCAGACITVNGTNAELAVQQSSFAGSGTGQGIDAVQCVGNGNTFSMQLVGNTFAGFATGIRVGSGCIQPSQIVHQTFHGNGVAVDYLGGTGHVLRNNIFTAQLITTVKGCTVPFAPDGRRDNLVYGNATPGCLETDLGTVDAHPLYVSSATGDFRLRHGSPAVNAAPDLLIDVNGLAPNNYLGSAPDFGGRETY